MSGIRLLRKDDGIIAVSGSQLSTAESQWCVKWCVPLPLTSQFSHLCSCRISAWTLSSSLWRLRLRGPVWRRHNKMNLLLIRFLLEKLYSVCASQVRKKLAFYKWCTLSSAIFIATSKADNRIANFMRLSPFYCWTYRDKDKISCPLFPGCHLPSHLGSLYIWFADSSL